MGQATSSLTECLGMLGQATAYDGVPAVAAPRRGVQRVTASSGTQVSNPSVPASAPPPVPPPFVPDKNAVYDLCADEEEDACPTCLEPYAEDNPKIVAQCGHAYHLQCIVAWETRSGSSYCPICAKPMEYTQAGGGKPV